MRRAVLRAFAKINYALEVRRKRPDGYHEIATILQSVSLADELEIERADEGFELLVEPEGVEIGPPEENTIFRASELLEELTGDELAVRVRLRKGIPAGAGLGGGSADGAAALVGLNGLFGLGLSANELEKIGLRIGADVPFCLTGGTVLGEGIGEVLTPLPAPPPHALVLTKPEASADTAGIYRGYEERPSAERPCVIPVMEALEAEDLGALARSLGNALAPATKTLTPEVAKLEGALLRAGALGVAMSGSGSAVYGVFGSEAVAQAAASRLPAPFVAVCVPVGRGVELLRGPCPASRRLF